MSLDRFWDFLVWLSPYAVTAYVGLIVLVILRLVWLGHHERMVGDARRGDRW